MRLEDHENSEAIKLTKATYAREFSRTKPNDLITI